MNETDLLSIHKERDLNYISSLNVVAYLLTKGIKYSDIKKTTHSVVFGFVNSDVLEYALKEYKENTHLQSFIYELKKVRSIVKTV